MAIARNFDANWTAQPGPLDTPCHIWRRGKSGVGYGQLSVDGRVIGAHRFAYEQRNGPIPSGMQVLHACDTPACVNADHLRLGGHRANATDREIRGRGNHVKGEDSGSAKLNETDVERIRDLHRSGLSQRRIAGWLFLTRAAVRAVVTGRTWSHLGA